MCVPRFFCFDVLELFATMLLLIQFWPDESHSSYSSAINRWSQPTMTNAKGEICNTQYTNMMHASWSLIIIQKTVSPPLRFLQNRRGACWAWAGHRGRWVDYGWVVRGLAILQPYLQIQVSIESSVKSHLGIHCKSCVSLFRGFTRVLLLTPFLSTRCMSGRCLHMSVHSFNHLFRLPHGTQRPKAQSYQKDHISLS